MSSLLVYNVGQLVTCEKGAKFGKDMNNIGLKENCALYIENGIIKEIFGQKKPNVKADEKIDAKNNCVIPGLIDCHTHLVFGGFREEEYSMRLSGKSYNEIMNCGGGIINTVKATRKESKKELLKKAKERINTMISHGITTVESKSGYGLDKNTELKMLEINKELNKSSKIEVVSTYLGAHAIPNEYKDKREEYIDFICNKMLKTVKDKKLAEFVDVFCEPNVFTLEESERILKCAKDMGFKLKIHADEMCAYGGTGLAGKLNLTSADHLLSAKKEDLKKLVSSKTVAVVLPATAFSLKEEYADARFMIDNGLCVAIASDFNPGSCFCNNFSFVQCLSSRNCNLTQEEVISAITVNAAYALNRKDIGSIEVGKKADFCILNKPSYKFMAYNIASSCVDRVYKGGKEIYRKCC